MVDPGFKGVSRETNLLLELIRRERFGWRAGLMRQRVAGLDGGAAAGWWQPELLSVEVAW